METRQAKRARVAQELKTVPIEAATVPIARSKPGHGSVCIAALQTVLHCLGGATAVSSFDTMLSLTGHLPWLKRSDMSTWTAAEFLHRQRIPFRLSLPQTVSVSRPFSLAARSSRFSESSLVLQRWIAARNYCVKHGIVSEAKRMGSVTADDIVHHIDQGGFAVAAIRTHSNEQRPLVLLQMFRGLNVCFLTNDPDRQYHHLPVATFKNMWSGVVFLLSR